MSRQPTNRQSEAQALLKSDERSVNASCCQPKTKLEGGLYLLGCVGLWGGGLWALNAYALHMMSTGCAAGFGSAGGAMLGVKGCCPVFCCNEAADEDQRGTDVELTATSPP